MRKHTVRRLIAWVMAAAMLAGALTPNFTSYAAEHSSPVEIDDPGCENTDDDASSASAEYDATGLTEVRESDEPEILGAVPPSPDFAFSRTSIDFGDLPDYYTAAGTPEETVTLTYTGSESGYLRRNPTLFDVDLDSNTYEKDKVISVTIRPRRDLPCGLHNEMIKFYTASGEYAQIEVTVNVIKATASIEIIDPPGYSGSDWGALRIGDETTAEAKKETFTVKNTGNIALRFQPQNNAGSLVFTPVDEMILMPGDTVEVTVRPEVTRRISGTTSLWLNTQLCDDHWYVNVRGMSLDYRFSVDYTLSGEVKASDLNAEEQYHVIGDTVIVLEEGDDVVLQKQIINNGSNDGSLTIKGSETGSLTLKEGVEIEGDILLESGIVRTVNKGLKSSGAITVTGGTVEIHAPDRDALSAHDDVKISGGVVNISDCRRGINSSHGKAVLCGDAVVFSKGEVYYGICACGIEFSGNAWVDAAAGGDGIAVLSTSDITISDNACLHAKGGLAATAIFHENGFMTPSEDHVVLPAGLSWVYSPIGYDSYAMLDEYGNLISIATEVTIKRKEAPAITVTPVNIFFPTTDYGEPSISKTITVGNSGRIMEQIRSVTLSSGIASDYELEDITGRYLAPGSPLTFTLRPKGKLSAGDHNGTLTVTTQTGTTNSANITFHVNDPVATISATPSSLDFGKVKDDYSNIGAKTVTIKNTGNTEVNLEYEEPEDYEVTLSGSKLAKKDDTATLTIRPKTGLPVGDHSLDDFYVESAEGAFARIDTHFEVEAYRYELKGDQEEIDLGRMHVGYTTAAEKTLKLTNTGEKPLHFTGVDRKSGQAVIRGLEGKTLAPGKSMNVTVTLQEGVSASYNYASELYIRTEEHTDWRLYVKYSVEYFIEGTVHASELAEKQLWRAYGDTLILLDPGEQIVTDKIIADAALEIAGADSGSLELTNGISAAGALKIGSGTVRAGDLYSEGGIIISGNAEVETGRLSTYVGKDISLRDNCLVNVTGTDTAPAILSCGKLHRNNNAYLMVTQQDPTKCAIIVKDGVDPGTDGRIWLPDGGTVGDYAASPPYLTVLDGTTPATCVHIGPAATEGSELTLRSPDLDFGTYTEDDLIPEARTITLVNTGKTILVLKDIAVPVNYDLTAPDRKVLRPGESTELILRPKELEDGEYPEPIVIDADKVDAQTITPTVTVIDPIYELELTMDGRVLTETDFIDFGTLIVGYEGELPHEVTVTNKGNLTLSMQDPERVIATNFPGGFSVSKLSAEELRPGESATFTVSINPVYTTYSYEQARSEILVKGVSPKGSTSSKFGVKYCSIATLDGIWMMDIPDQTYTGSAIKPEPEVYFRTTVLTRDDYTVTWKNNINVPASAGNPQPTVTVTGKGNYKGTISKTFTIKPADIAAAYADSDAQAARSGANLILPSNGRDQKGNIRLYYDLPGRKKVALVENRDYTLAYAPSVPKDPGLYTVTVTGKGNYDPLTSRALKIEITDKDTRTQLNRVTFPAIPAQQYDGKSFILTGDADPLAGETNTLDTRGNAYTWVLTDRLKKPAHDLVKGTDYEIWYDNNREIGTATVTLVGKGSYAGVVTKTFRITGTALTTMQQKNFDASYLYTGEPRKQLGRFYDKKKGLYLIEGLDYDADYTNNVEVGTATVVYTGKGYYTGTVKKTYKITGYSMSKAAVTDLSGSRDYGGFYDNKAKAFVYTGSPFMIAGTETGTDDQEIRLSYTNPDKTSFTLSKGEDYTVRYSKHTDPGTAIVEFVGKGRFTGTLRKTFRIKAYPAGTDPEARIKVYYEKDKVWEKAPDNTKPEYKFLKNGVCPEPIVEYTYRGTKTILAKGKDYTLAYADNRVSGKATGTKPPTVTITTKGKYEGKLERRFNILETGDATTCTVTAADKIINYDMTDYDYGKKDFHQVNKTMCIPITTKITIKDASGALLKEGTDYYKPGDKDHPYDYEMVYGSGYCRMYEDWIDKRTRWYSTDPSSPPLDEYGNLRPDVYLQPGTVLLVTIPGKGAYEGQNFTGSYAWSWGDLSRATVKVRDQAYTGRQARLTADDITATIRVKNKVINLRLDEDFWIDGNSYENNVRSGNARVTITADHSELVPGSTNTRNYGGRRTLTYKITPKQMNHTIHYAGNNGDATAGLIKALIARDGSHDAEYYAERYRVTTTAMRDSVIPIGGKLAANTYRVQKKSERGQWANVAAKDIAFARWDTSADGTGHTFADKADFTPDWIERLIYGEELTLYAQWQVNTIP